MKEKMSHLVGEKAFGGAIPLPLKREFDALLKRTGWKKKRVVAAAILALLRASKTVENTDSPHDTEAARWYAQVGRFYEVMGEQGGETSSTQSQVAPVLDQIFEELMGGKRKKRAAGA